LAKITVTKGGESDTDATDANRANLNTAANHKLLVGSGATGYDLTTECTNDFYYQFGFYSTGTPRWNRDLSQNNHNMGKNQRMSRFHSTECGITCSTSSERARTLWRLILSTAKLVRYSRI